MFYQDVCLELEKVKRQIKEIEQKIKRYPKGMLFSCKNGKYHKWYHSTKNKTVYIPKKNKVFAEKLFEKKYYTCLLQDYMREKKALEAYLKAYGSPTSQVEELLNSPKYRELIPSLCKPMPEKFKEWVEEKYPQNPFYPENKKIRGITGELLRSKSEAMIEQALYLKGIPYRYECELKLGDSVHYPDFMILHPVTGELFIWEHYGLMDNNSYVRKKCAEMEEYIMNGFYPTINFITTFENKEHPLDVETIERMIATYLT